MAAEAIVEEIEIEAAPSAVFRHFVEPEALIRWMGDYAVLDPRPGGEFTLDIKGVPIRGEYVEVSPPSRLVIAWGHADSDALPPGSSRVEVSIEKTAVGCRVRLVHSGLPETERSGFEAGWRHYGARLRIAAGGSDPGADPGM